MRRGGFSDAGDESGGAGTAEHVLEILAAGVADAALVAGVLHEELMSVGEIKRLLARHGVPVREMVPC